MRVRIMVLAGLFFGSVPALAQEVVLSCCDAKPWQGSLTCPIACLPKEPAAPACAELKKRVCTSEQHAEALDCLSRETVAWRDRMQDAIIQAREKDIAWVDAEQEKWRGYTERRCRGTNVFTERFGTYEERVLRARSRCIHNLTRQRALQLEQGC